MLAHAPRNAPSGCCGMSHVAAIAYVLPATGLIWPHVIGAQNHAIFFGYKCLFFRPHPIGQRLGFTHVRVECVCGGFANDRKDDRSDSWGIAGFGFSDMHGLRIEIRGLCPQWDDGVEKVGFPFGVMLLGVFLSRLIGGDLDADATDAIMIACQADAARRVAGGGPRIRSAMVLRFCTVAARRNSSRAPERPRSRMRSKRW